ncbi:hypothetical protein ACFSGX_07260 [Sphingomonas arantia]|uniref:Lipoprotein n=1 Tax=Sphingomonas arantia TaxID=1460676 RepID=A0ABW4TXX6_9SPHN
MLHFLMFTFFTVTLFAAIAGCVTQLLASKDMILAALQLAPAPTVPVSAGVARVRIRYNATPRRVETPLRAAA